MQADFGKLVGHYAGLFSSITEHEAHTYLIWGSRIQSSQFVGGQMSINYSKQQSGQVSR